VSSRLSLAACTVFGALALMLTGSSASTSPKNEHFEQVFLDLKARVLKGDIAAAMPLYERAAAEAGARNRRDYQLKFLFFQGNCEFLLSRFQRSLKTLQEARVLAQETHELLILAKVDSNLSSLFLELGNLTEASKLAEEGLSLSSGMEKEPGNWALQNGQLAVIRAEQHLWEQAEEKFDKSVQVAGVAGDFRAQALLLDGLAYERYQAGHFPEAEEAAQRGLEVRMCTEAGNTANSLMILGMAQAGRGHYLAAVTQMDGAVRALRKPRNATPLWRVYLRRGQIKLEMGNYAAALEDVREALKLAREWRADVPPNDASRTSSEEKLAELYGTLVEAGSRLYLETRNPELIAETFEAAEENRARSLRALLPEQNGWRKKLPARYDELLFKLNGLQTMQLARGESKAPEELFKVRAELAALEAGIGGSLQETSRRALERAQGSLDADATLFSFELGEKGSWLWAVTSEGITLHALPPRADLAQKVALFREVAHANGKDLGPAGYELYRALFGSVDPKVLAHPRWLLILEGDLFNLPFAALNEGGDRLLIEEHSLQIVPGALMLQANRGRSTSRGPFLGVGDPIYNQADPRADRANSLPWPVSLWRSGYGGGPGFARLWGTAKEIEVSARTWNAKQTLLLTGKQVSPDLFWKATRAQPEIIHIATHVLEEHEKPKTGWIAFSLGAEGVIQYVTPEDIMANSISARLIVLSGCSSGQADIHPATGLMGLTRAWLAAGADSVLATRWPVVDDDGMFFESFYRNLNENGRLNPAIALQKTSVEMVKSGTWRANPSFWAGYFLIGN
jgi:tetratricopeptide (TPR) repeat protein